MIVLTIALIIGVTRVFIGTADGTGTLVNTAWVLYDLVVLSVIIQAARYRGPAARVLEKEPHGSEH
jgi:cellulose synthase (UDP-forming)